MANEVEAGNRGLVEGLGMLEEMGRWPEIAAPRAGALWLAMGGPEGASEMNEDPEG